MTSKETLKIVVEIARLFDNERKAQTLLERRVRDEFILLADGRPVNVEQFFEKLKKNFRELYSSAELQDILYNLLPNPFYMSCAGHDPDNGRFGSPLKLPGLDDYDKIDYAA